MFQKTRISIFLVMMFSMSFLFFPTTAFGIDNMQLDFPIGLKVGDTTNIDSDLTMTLLSVEDSRCPSDVTCVWQGNVLATVQLEKGTQDLGVFTISNESLEEDEQTFDGYYIRLTNIEPYPTSDLQISQSDYTLTFFVSMAEQIVDSPLKQFKSGIAFRDIVCDLGLQLTQRYDGTPACVKPDTYSELIKRDWVSDIIKAVQSTDSSGIDDIQPIIKTGTSSGFCIGYCSHEFIITPEKITHIQSGRDVSEKTSETLFSKSAWNDLISLIDFQEFQSLPDQIGCPGCADAPVQWIEISYGDKTKKIEFEIQDVTPEIKELFLALQEIRNPIESQIDSDEDPSSNIAGKRSPVDVPDATSENDMYCSTSWNISTSDNLDSTIIEQSVQSTIAQFGITYFLEERVIDVSENTSGYRVSISGLWNQTSIQYQMITEDLEKFGLVEGEPAMCT